MYIVTPVYSHTLHTWSEWKMRGCRRRARLGVRRELESVLEGLIYSTLWHSYVYSHTLHTCSEWKMRGCRRRASTRSRWSSPGYSSYVYGMELHIRCTDTHKYSHTHKHTYTHTSNVAQSYYLPYILWYYKSEYDICTRWRRTTECLKLQIIFCKRDTNYRALLRKMTYEDKPSYASSPPCIMILFNIACCCCWGICETHAESYTHHTIIWWYDMQWYTIMQTRKIWKNLLSIACHGCVCARPACAWDCVSES